VESAVVVPDGLITDPSVLHLWPSPNGMQHDEVATGYGWLSNLLNFTWTRQDRSLPLGGEPLSKAIIHRSVYKRFDCLEVQLCDAFGPYRPEALRLHLDFARFYDPAAQFPAKSEKAATSVAGNPIKPHTQSDPSGSSANEDSKKV
jgi:hypothetical protein